MGKATFKGFVPPDDPMFSTGPEIFSRHESSASSPSSATSTDGATQDQSSSATGLPDLQNLPEDPALGAIRAMQSRSKGPSTSGNGKA